MRIFAQVLFWVGLLEVVVCAILLVHVFASWRWRRNTLIFGLSNAWLFLFIVLSIVLYPGVLSLAVRGTGYVEAHLYGGIWTNDAEALSNILLRWQNIWLPIYIPWVGVWLSGMVFLMALNMLRKPKSVDERALQVRREIMKHLIERIHLIVFIIIGLLLVACSNVILAQSGLDTLATLISQTPTAMPLRDTPPPTTSNQPAHNIQFFELGMSITLPPDWNSLKQPGTVLLGPGLNADNSMERTWMHLSINRDVPQTLPELTKVMTEGMRTVGHITQLTTTRIIVGGSEGIAIWWIQPAPRDPNQPENWVSIYVPAHGLVHEIVFHPILVAPDGKQLKSVGQIILDSIRFLRLNRYLLLNQYQQSEQV